MRIEFPVYVTTVVRKGERQYLVRPLFRDGPLGRGRRFEKAMRNLQKEIRRELRDVHLNRLNMADYLYYVFNPELRFKRLDLEFRAGSRLISGKFAAAWFDLKGKRFVCLPGFASYLYIHKQSDAAKPALSHMVDGIEDAVLGRFRALRKELGEEPDPALYYSPRGDFLTSMELDVNIGHDRFPFDPGEDIFFAMLSGGRREMRGETEIVKVGHDLNLRHPDELERAVYRDEMVERIGDIIYRPDNAALMLVGPRGCGKTVLLHEALRRHIDRNTKRPFNQLEKIWHIDPVRVIAGMSVVGMWQKRWEAIIEYASKRLESHKYGRDKLYVDNIVALLRVGKSASNNMTLADVLKPVLEKRRLTFIGEATPEEWKVVQELDRSFADLFEVIRLREATLSESVKIAAHERVRLEQEHNCKISNPAVAEIFGLRANFLEHTGLPGGVTTFLKQLAVRHSNGGAGQPDVIRAFQDQSGLNPSLVDRGIRLNREAGEEFIGRRLVGQPAAVSAMTDVVHMVKAGLNDPEKPYGVFLFIGPTGAGKTQAAKALAEYLFQGHDALVRLDMNEFVDGGAVSRLIGDFNKPDGLLTSRVKRRPFCVLLLDEIEKAHPGVHDLLLQVLGEGRLTNALGRTVNFTRTIIIMTSNLGAREAGKTLGFGKAAADAAPVYQKAVRNFFRPEFINRIDRVVSFRRLSPEDFVHIARIQIGELLARDGFTRRNMILNISENVLHKLAGEGFDPDMGGRALKRVIERDLTALTARQVAGMPPGKPMLFDVYLLNGRLTPRVTILERCDMPAGSPIRMPESRGGVARFLRNLLRDINALEEKTLESHESSESAGPDRKVDAEDWVLYNFKDQVSETRSELRNILNNLKVFYDRPGSLPAREADRGRRPMRVLDEESRMELQEMFNRAGMREFMNSAYQNAQPIAPNETTAPYLRYLLDVAYLSLFARSIREGGGQRVGLHIESLVQGAGAAETEYLKSLYRTAFEIFDFSIEGDVPIDDDPSRACLLVQGAGVRDLLANETGVHMFFTSRGTAVPVTVRLVNPEANESAKELAAHRARERENAKPEDPGNIIRLYSLSEESSGEDAMIDLRGGLVGRANTAHLDPRILFYGGIRAGRQS